MIAPQSPRRPTVSPGLPMSPHILRSTTSDVYGAPWAPEWREKLGGPPDRNTIGRPRPKIDRPPGSLPGCVPARTSMRIQPWLRGRSGRPQTVRTARTANLFGVGSGRAARTWLRAMLLP
eukprot:8632578-Pyramimonas_sp.AAC.1